MGAKIQIFHKTTLLGKELNVYGDAENPLFLARDVAEWIEYDMDSINKMSQLVDEDEKLTGTIFRSGQNRQATFLTENGLYEILMQSRKPIAKQFKKGIKEILRSVRKHGAYMTQSTLEQALTSPDFLIQLATKLKEEQIKSAMLEEKNQILEEQNRVATPKVEYHDTVLMSTDTYTTNQIAKELGISAVTLNKKLKSLGIQYSQSGQWLLYAKYQNKGYTKTHTYTFTHVTTGQPGTKMRTVWTEKGRKFIHELLNKPVLVDN